MIPQEYDNGTEKNYAIRLLNLDEWARKFA
jgi:hypothetical protein